MSLTTNCDNRFFCTLHWTSRGMYKTGEINSVEITQLVRTETRHNFLVHGDLLRASLYGRQGWDSVLVPQWILFIKHSNIHHARVKTKSVIVKAVQGTCLWTNWCEVLLLHKSQYLNEDTKEQTKVSLKSNKNYLNIPSVSMMKRISKLKRQMQ